MFTTTSKAVDLKSDQVEIIDDIVHNGVNFSDGCGFISPELALKVAEQFNQLYMSAFQVRIAGCKGMLVVNHELEGEKIQVRRSMVKFKYDEA